MEAKVLQGMQSSTWIMRERIVMRKQDSSLQFFQRSGEKKWSGVPASCCLRTRKRRSDRLVALRVSCSSGNVPDIASKLGLKDVCDVTSTTISIEVLSQIEYFLKK
ncbi:UNVERIFIED_CONTAM: hypothetical protein Slati_0002800 [Sesamum latifolium]|uniref:Uncharacterized protein n=1 Tax=Sesamum latifolium TaxID=2727402 RepID=A0AAW2Y6K4_9LAMI